MKTESELLSRCREIEGLTIGQLATQLKCVIPTESLQRKGWAGVLIEKALGTEAGNQSLPDFTTLGICNSLSEITQSIPSRFFCLP